MRALDAWNDAKLAATLLAVDPDGLGGAVVHGQAGPTRDAWLAFFRTALPSDAPLRRLPLHISDERLLGGLDWLEAMHHGSASYRSGALAETDGGFVVLPSSERTSTRLRSHLAVVVDDKVIALERDGISRRIPASVGIIALDESLEDESSTPAQILDRLAFIVDLIACDHAKSHEALDVADVIRARLQLPHVVIAEDTVHALCAVAWGLGIDSLRPSILAVQAARAIAALSGRSTTTVDDAQVAARLVLMPRATQLPSSESEDIEPDEATESPPPSGTESTDENSQRDETRRDDSRLEHTQRADTQRDDTKPASSDDLVLAATLASLPLKLLERISRAPIGKSRRDQQGRAGALQRGATGGRPVGTRAGKPGGGVRLNLVETLRTAAPWQRARLAAAESDDSRRIRIRATDLRTTRYKRRTQTVTVFVVDASGSAALNRLAEAKGAVELLLADCYVRRDQVCVIAFRGTCAELILPPTRSLVRAKRHLAGLAGGGATPLASALQLVSTVAEQCMRAGQSVTQVVLTDGSANVALDGSLGRARGEADAHAMAVRIRALGASTILIDIANRAQRQAQSLASAMGARYVWLPLADAATISGTVKSAGRQMP